jgi:hypothetical protein
MKILLLDIETAPNLVHVWGLWQQNVGLPQILDAGYVLCWAAKWLGKSEVFFDSAHQSKPKEMLQRIHDLIDQADAVVHYNGKKFDIPTLNKEFLLHDFTPPAPYKQIDLLNVARNQFKFPSNKLDYIAQALHLGKKTKHAGHELWIKCMNKDPEAWKQMEEYNKNDVLLLERVYYKLLPWIKDHPHSGLYREEGSVCPNCGSSHYHSRGYAYTKTMRYNRYQCQDCGSWFRDKNNNLKLEGFRNV